MKPLLTLLALPLLPVLLLALVVVLAADFACVWIENDNRYGKA